MGPRLIIVSNRVAVPDTPGAPLAGGMAVAVKAALKNRNGMWFGWSGKVTDEPTGEPQRGRGQQDHLCPDRSVEDRHPGILQRPRQQRAVADPSLPGRPAGIFARRRERLHARQPHVRRPPEPAAQGGRRRLGARLSSDAARRASCASRGHRNPIGFFLHTPCAPPDILQTLPHHREILGGLTYYDLVGFQTENDRDNFAHYLDDAGRDANPRRAYEFDGRQVRLGAFPVSIETKAYMRLARNAGRSAMIALVRESLGGNRLVLGVDRLDYSKGIPDRIKAFERLLEINPEWRGKVTLLQVTPKSRSEIRQYGEIETEVTGLIGKVNGRFGDAAWTPIRYVNRSYSRTVLAGLYRAADVAHGDAAARRHESRRQGISSPRRTRTIPACWCCRNSPARRRSSTAR